MKTSPIWNKCKALVCFLILLSSNVVLATNNAPHLEGQPKYQVEYCQTASAISTIEQAIDCTYLPKYSPLKLGLEESSRWVRIRIFSAREKQRAFAIRVAPYFLKEINFYQKTDADWVSEISGSKISPNQTYGDIGGHLFVTAENASNENTYYLKIKASSLTHIAVSVQDWPNKDVQNFEHLLGIGTQAGILLTILVFSLVSLALNPSIIMARFSLSIADLILCVLSGSGLIAIYFLKSNPWLNELIFNWALCLRLGLWVWVSQGFLIDFKTPPWYKGTCWIIYCLVGMSMLMVTIDKTNVSNALMLIGIIVTPAIQIVAILKTPNISKAYQTALISGFCISILLFVMAVLSVLFPYQNNSPIPVYLARLTDLVNPLVVLSIIVFQARLVRRELAEVKTTLTETRLKSEYESKLLQDRSTLINMLAHELKNPLASIELAVDNLSQSIDVNNDYSQRRLRNINHSILNMDAIIERCNLMNFIDHKSLVMNVCNVNLRPFIIDLIENMECNKEINLGDFEAIFLDTDPQFLKIILSNLIENGLKYSPPQSRLRINAELFSDTTIKKVCISITNPINRDLAPDPKALFNRYYRHQLAQKTRGSGLGLYICKELSTELGGTIQYQQHNEEVTFLIELPL